MKKFSVIKLLIYIILIGSISLLVFSSIYVSKKGRIQKEQIEYNDTTNNVDSVNTQDKG
jgi:hypothetical protein